MMNRTVENAVRKIAALAAIIAGFAMPAMADGAAPVLNPTQSEVHLLHAVGNIEDFAASGQKAPEIEMDFSMLAGKQADWTNEYGRSTFAFNPKGTLRYSDDNGAQNLEGYWWINPKHHLCVVTSSYWPHGSCFIVRGEDADHMTALSPTWSDDIVYPMALGQ